MFRRFSRTSLLLPAFAALCVIHFVAARAVAQSPRYTVTDLGAFTVRAINDRGEVVGQMVNKAVLYRDGAVRDITPPGAVSAVANGINNRGEVAGSVSFCDFVDGNCLNIRARAFIYRDGTFTILGTLGGRDSHAFAINDDGQVVGYSDIAGPTPQTGGASHAFIYKDGVFDDINARLGTHDSFAQSINASGQVTGFSSSGAFLYQNGTATFIEFRGSGADVNNQGQVVGGLTGNDDGSGRAFRYSAGVSQDLGTLSSGHRFSAARAINDAGEVVGISSPSFFIRGHERAFIHSGGIMQNLNALIPAGSGWVLVDANAINDAGQIAGRGFLNGNEQEHAFLLTRTEPVLLTEPGTTRAIAFDSVTLLRDSFPFATLHNFSADRRTRILLFVRNVELSTGETALPLTVQAEDALGRSFPLPVESFRKVPRFNALTQVVVRLPDELAEGGDVQVTISFRGNTSNKAVFQIKPSTANPQ